MIRGRSGTKVKLSILRGNTNQFFYVTRGTIPLPAVDAAYMIDATTGYIKMSKFSETTYREFMENMENFKKAGMNSLVLDLRGNGGGLLSQATAIADEFLDGDKMIVYTEGTNTPRQEYHARKPGVFEEGKLAVLVDELTASASEILSGALQDYDRATIIGRRTFGKGLVQEQYSLSDGSALRLTIARYYTPLGRSIQKPYEKGNKKVYMEDLYNRYQNGEMLTADSMHFSKEHPYKTKGGRTVYGGGGIAPDVFVPIDSSLFIKSVTRLYLDGRFNNFVYSYYTSHVHEWDKYKSPNDFLQNYQNSEDAWKDLVSFAAKDSINLRNIPAKDKLEIQAQIKAYLARAKWRTQGFYQVSNANDKTIKAALAVLKK
jgi:carboxyl-terminal processing protease